MTAPRWPELVAARDLILRWLEGAPPAVREETRLLAEEVARELAPPDPAMERTHDGWDVAGIIHPPKKGAGS